MSERPPAGGGMSTTRIETLCDGVFAIVMTLLVLDVKVPALPPGATSADYLHELALLWPRFLGFVLSFLIAGIYWVGHHNQFFFIRAADRLLLWLNILFLMCVAFIPFSTAFMSEYSGSQVPVVIYGANLIAAGLALYVHWWYATTNRRLVDQNISEQAVRLASRRILMGPAGYLIAIALSFISTRLSLVIFVLVPALFIVPWGIDRHLRRPVRAALGRAEAG